MVLFDIRRDESHAGFLAAVNRGLASEPGNPYVARFGPVASPRWWECFERGEVPVKTVDCTVTQVGEDGIELTRIPAAGRQPRTHTYDREGPWAAHRFQLGDRVTLLRTRVELPTPTGPLIFLVDIRAEWHSSG